MKRLKQMQAGRYVLACCYTAIDRYDSEKARSEKQKIQSAAQAQMNLKYSYQKCLMTLAANFENGIFVTLTYDDAHLLPNRREAVNNLTRFVRLMRREYARKGLQFEYIYCTEGKHGDKRLHHHMVCNDIEGARELIDSMWGAGETSVKPVTGDTLQNLASYFTKEAREDGRKVGQRAWTPSKGLRKPIVEIRTIPDNMAICPPANCTILDMPTFRNEYGTGETCFYILPDRKRS